MISQRSAVAAFFLLIVVLAAGVLNHAPRQITSPSSSAFRLPVLPGVTVTVTQGNNQGDHIAMNGSEYAFDLKVGQQNFVIAAAQAGTVIGVNDSSTVQCSGFNTESTPESKPLKDCWAYANFVLIADDDGTTAALYVHLLPYANNASMPKVTLREHVNQGEPIGLAGTTGYSSGVHLHFQVEILPSAAAQQSQQPLGWWWTNSRPISFSNPEIIAKDACLHIASNGVPQTGQCFVVSKLTGAPSPTPTPHSAGIITLFPLPDTNSNPAWITAGSDGNVWFTEVSYDEAADNILTKIGRITPAGSITLFPLPAPDTNGVSTYPVITAGPDGNLWFTYLSGSRIGRITPTGQITEFPLPPNHFASGITTGPDGNLWITESGYDQIGRIGRMTPAGSITEFPLATDLYSDSITAGPDGNLWFTIIDKQVFFNQIGRITPAGIITLFPLPTSSSPRSVITAGPDGNLWFTECNCPAPGYYSAKIGRITPTGQITEFPLSFGGLLGITTGPDGNLWFTDYNFDQNNSQIGRITPAGQITEFPLPGKDSGLLSITTGPDGNLWFTEVNDDKIGRITS
jgi:virginiamycin B lyase